MGSTDASTDDVPVEADGLHEPDVAQLLPDPTLIMRSDGQVRWANLAAEELFGWTLEQWQGRNALPLVHPDDLAHVMRAFESVHGKSIGTPVEARLRTASGSYRVVEARGRSLAATHGTDDVLLVFRDLTDRRRWEFAHGNVRVFQTLLEYTRTIILLLDEAGVIRSGGAAVPRQLGHDLADIEGRRLEWLVAPGYAREVQRQIALAAGGSAVAGFEAHLRHHDGTAVPYELTVINLIDDPVVAGLVVTAHDVTKLYNARQEMAHRANHDALTGLPNRTLFRDRLEHAAQLARRRNSSMGVFYCDLDGLKAVNDSLGHAVGDDVLRAAARKLVDAARSADTVARLGGDEFVIVAEDIDDAAGAEIADRIDGAFSTPLLLGGQEMHVGVSVGWTVFDGADPEGALEVADARMYEAKRAARVATDGEPRS